MNHKLPIILLIAFLTTLPVHQALAACDDDCVEIEQWNINLALGLSDFTTAYNHNETISPITIMTDITWYGEHYYYDNTEIGRTQWFGDLELDVYVRLNPEKWLLQSAPTVTVLPIPTATATMLVEEGNTPGEDGIVSIPVPGDPVNDQNSGDALAPDEPSDTPQVSLNNTRIDPDWALDAGLRVRYPLERVTLSAAFNKDVSAVYQGYELSLGLQYGFQWLNWSIATNVGTSYKSDQLVDYYYGFGSSTSLSTNLRGGWFPRFTMSATKPINNHWGWLLNGSFQGLPSSVEASPIVNNSHFLRLFAGVTYAF